MVSLLTRRAAPAAVAAPQAWRATEVVVRRSARSSVMGLARAEARWLLRHPLSLVGLGFSVFALFVVRTAGAGSAFADLTGGGAPGVYVPPLVFFAANLAATRSRRAGVDETHAASPVGRTPRTAAQCAAGLAPAAAVLVLVVSANIVRGLESGTRTIVPTAAELLLLPLSVLGATTLGVMVARWLPWRGAAMVVFVALVAVSIALSGGASVWWGSMVELVEWRNHELTEIRIAGSASWHAAYLLGLSTMATIGALLRDTSRRLQLLGIGAVVTLLTAGAGWAQLP